MNSDVIVVGAGSAGSVIAARLSEDSERSVTLLEAGPSFTAIARLPPEIRRVGSLAAAVPGHPNNWAYTGALTPQLTYSVPRGKIIGGSSSINGGYFMRAVPQDFDRWVQAGNDEWSWEEVLPYYRKLEDDHDFSGPLHGSGGPIPVKRQDGDLMSPLTAAFIEACLQAGFSEEQDKNCPGTPGIGLVPLNAVDGVRMSTAIGYLIPNQDRPNLLVQGDAFVRRVIFERRRAIGVEAEIDGRRELLFGSQVVLCAGAIASPQLLILSGIGPAEELRALGIDVVHDSPGVGKEFADHPELWVTFRPKRMMMPSHPHMAFHQAALNFTAEGSDIAGDLELLCGVLSIGQMTLGTGLSSLRGAAEILRRPVRTLEALRGLSMRRLLDQAHTHADLPLLCGLQQEQSRGELLVTSVDPHVAPALHYNYLSEPSDLERMRHAVRAAADLLEVGPLRRLIAARTSPGNSDLATDRALDQWMRNNLATAIHMSATCRMGPESDDRAVVDQRFRVHGVRGLRVVDTSAMPHLIRRGPNATAVMMGERAAAFIAEEPPLAMPTDDLPLDREPIPMRTPA
ncbi:MAG: GMC family oxidoreductase N-terminal domain-containing protein [Solirubrobacteraceae bacterium]|jgi:choline dehydrogenase-like flavoprotein